MDVTDFLFSNSTLNIRRVGWVAGGYLDSSFPSQNTTVYSWPWEEKKAVCFPQGSMYMKVAKVGSFIWLTTDRARGRCRERTRAWA